MPQIKSGDDVSHLFDDNDIKSGDDVTSLMGGIEEIKSGDDVTKRMDSSIEDYVKSLIKTDKKLSEIPNPNEFEQPDPVKGRIDKAAEFLFKPFGIAEKTGKELAKRGYGSSQYDSYLEAFGKSLKRDIIEGAANQANIANIATLGLGSLPGAAIKGSLLRTAGLGTSTIQAGQAANQLEEGNYSEAAMNAAMAMLGFNAHMPKKLAPLPKKDFIDVEGHVVPITPEPPPPFTELPPSRKLLRNPNEQLGLRQPTGPLPYPNNLIPNVLADKLRAPTANEIVFNALLPESLRGNKPVIRGPLTPPKEPTSATLTLNPTNKGEFTKPKAVVEANKLDNAEVKKLIEAEFEKMSTNAIEPIVDEEWGLTQKSLDAIEADRQFNLRAEELANQPELLPIEAEIPPEDLHPQISDRGMLIAEQELRDSYGLDTEAAEEAISQLHQAFQNIDPIKRTGLKPIGSGASDVVRTKADKRRLKKLEFKEPGIIDKRLDALFEPKTINEGLAVRPKTELIPDSAIKPATIIKQDELNTPFGQQLLAEGYRVAQVRPDGYIILEHGTNVSPKIKPSKRLNEPLSENLTVKTETPKPPGKPLSYAERVAIGERVPDFNNQTDAGIFVHNLNGLGKHGYANEETINEIEDEATLAKSRRLSPIAENTPKSSDLRDLGKNKLDTPSELPTKNHDRWQATVDYLDRQKAPDSSYRDILSTGAKDKLKKGENWRTKVLGYIEQSKINDGLTIAKDKDFSTNGTYHVTVPSGKTHDIYRDPESGWWYIDSAEQNAINPSTGRPRVTAFNKNEMLQKLKDIDSGKADKYGIESKQNDEPLASEVNPQNEPLSAAVGHNKIKVGMNINNEADAARIIMINSRSKYSGRVSVSAVKELIQNAGDATDHLGQGREISIEIDDFTDPISKEVIKTITVHDNGDGLGRADLQTLYTDLYKTGKSGDSTKMGKFGVGKGAYLIGGDHVMVESVVLEKGKKIAYSFHGTPEQLMKEVELHKFEVTDDTPTGIRTTTTIPADEEMQPALDYLDRVFTHSHGMSGHLNVTTRQHKRRFKWQKPDRTQPIETVTENYDLSAATPGKTIADVTHDDNTMFQITWGKGAHLEKSNMTIAHFLNNGLYQGTGYVTLRDKDGHTVNGATPTEVVVSVFSDAPETARNYPWEENRETVRVEHKNTIGQAINEFISAPASQAQADKLQLLYDAMPSFKLENGADFYVHDGGGKFTSDELAAFMAHPKVQELATLTEKTIIDYLHNIRSASGNKYSWEAKVTRVGFILNDNGLLPSNEAKYHMGIWIPHPAINSGKATILINPFSMIARGDVDLSSAGWEHTIIHELAHNEPTPTGEDAHGITHDYLMGELVQLIGARYAHEIRTHFTKIVTGTRDGTRYLPEVQEVLQRYTESRGRTEVQKDPLSTSGIGSTNRTKGTKDSLSGDVESNPERAIEKLNIAIRDAVPIREEQEAMYTIQRAARMKAANRVRKKGEAGFFARLKKLEGEYEKVEYEPGTQLTTAEINDLHNVIQESNLMPWEKIRTGIALLKILDGKAVPQRNELKLLGRAFGQELVDNIIEMHGGLGMVGDSSGIALRKVANETMSFTKSMRSALDLSGPLRQGLPMIYRKEYWSAAFEMFKYASSEKIFAQSQADLHTRPLAGYAKIMGLKLTDIGEDLTEREEQFMSVLADKYIPGVRMSNRAYTGFLNQLRANVFDNLTRQFEKAGLDPFNNHELGKDLAHYVNNATGRGSLGRFEKMGVELNMAIFSPRFVSSRATMLNPMYYKRLHPAVRKEAIKSLLAVAGIVVLMTEIAKELGADVSYVPTNPDFMKGQFDNTRIDMGAGFLQMVVFATKFIKGEATSSVTDRTTKLGSSYVAPTRFSISRDFARSKLSPVASFVISMMDAMREPGGKPLNFNRPDSYRGIMDNSLIQQVIPMYIQDVDKLIQEDPDLIPGLIMGSIGFLGGGIQTYEPAIDRNRMREMLPMQEEMRPLQEMR